MANLFAAASNSAGPKPLVSFRAGKMSKDGKTVTADKRKGLLQLVQGDDMLLHFQWKDRFTGQTEEDLMLFPGEATFTKVPQCTTGRVYMLDFKGTQRQLLYWIQEPKPDNDEENCRKLNEFINNPPTSHPLGGGGSGVGGDAAGDPMAAALAAAAAAGGDGAAAANLAAALNAGGGLNGMDRNQLLSLLGGTQQAGARRSAPKPAPKPPAAAAMAGGTAVTSPAPGGAVAGGGGGGVQLATLQSILASLGGPVPVPAASAASTAAAAAASRGPEVNLQHVLDPQEIANAIRQQPESFTSRLLEHLPPIPEGMTAEQHLIENLRSSQLQQTAHLFQSALEDPQAFHEIAHAFHLPPAPGFGTHAFIQAVEQANPPPPPPPTSTTAPTTTTATTTTSTTGDQMEVDKEPKPEDGSK